jgi:hypothetical protein
MEKFFSESVQPRRPGRPKGSRNRSPDEALTQKKLEQLYKRVEPMLDDEHKKYLHAILEGKTSIDAVREMQLLLRYLSILTTEAIGWALRDLKMNRDLAMLVGEYRQGIKDYEDMQRKREDAKHKRGDDERVVDPTRESAVARLAKLGAVSTEE